MTPGQQLIVEEARDVLKRAQAMTEASGDMADQLWKARHSLTPYLTGPDAVRDHFDAAQLDSQLHREWMRHRY